MKNTTRLQKLELSSFYGKFLTEDKDLYDDINGIRIRTRLLYHSTKLDLNGIEKCTMEILDILGYYYNDDYVVSMKLLNKIFRGKLNYSTLNTISKACIFGANDNLKIYQLLIPKSITIHRLRFVLALSVAYYILDYNITTEIDSLYTHVFIKSLKYAQYDNDENIHRYFARCLLMPRDNFMNKWYLYKNKLNNTSDVVNDLSTIFNVSKNLVKIRCKDLNLI